MGGTILGGSITTFGAGVFLFLASVSIFAKFAVLITCTIIFAFLYSMVYFSAMMHAFGPQEDFGNLMVPLKKLWTKIRGSKK
jgi:hypothetical protein